MAGESGTSAGVIDTRSLGKCESFSGEEQDWSGWKFKFEAWLSLVPTQLEDSLGVLESAERFNGPIVNDDLDGACAVFSRLVYAILVQMLKGRALNIARRVPRQAGLELWRVFSRSTRATWEPGPQRCWLES